MQNETGTDSGLDLACGIVFVGTAVTVALPALGGYLAVENLSGDFHDAVDAVVGLTTATASMLTANKVTNKFADSFETVPTNDV